MIFFAISAISNIFIGKYQNTKYPKYHKISGSGLAFCHSSNFLNLASDYDYYFDLIPHHLTNYSKGSSKGSTGSGLAFCH